MSANDDVIKRIQAANADKIEAFKQKNRKGGQQTGPRQKRTDPKQTIDDTIAEIARQMGVGTTAQPSAPIGTGEATRPISIPQAAFNSGQNAVHQVNQAAQQMSQAMSPPSVRDLIDAGINPALAIPQSASAQVQSGFGGYKQPDVLRPSIQRYKIREINQGFGYKAPPKVIVSQTPSIQMPEVKGKEFDRSAKEILKQTIKDDREVKKTLREEVKIIAKEDRASILKSNGKQNATTQYREERSRLHPSMRRAFDQAYGNRTPEEDDTADRVENGNLIAGVGSKKYSNRGGLNNFAIGLAMRSMISSINHTVSALNGHAEFTPNATTGFMSKFLSIGPNLAKIGFKKIGVLAEIAEATAELVNSYHNSANLEVRSDMDLAMRRNSFGSDKRFSEISANAAKLATGSQTWFQRTTNALGWKGELQAEINNSAAKTLNADEKARTELYLYGNEAEKAVVRWAVQNKIPLAAVPDEVRRELKEGAIKAIRKKYETDSEVLRQVDAETPDDFFLRGASKDDFQKKLRQKSIDDIFLNSNGAYGINGRLTPSEQRQHIDRDIEHYLRLNARDIHRIDEENRNIELKMKAERHRHLAEF